ncbi:hypothetical protein Sfulv_60500 [Streptomyces fulvorobeus]|uniref:Uncharacterized protein n=1 Tax=Streptomyces fulvorobeus TaxID=284028 RepID=A0A7J0CFG3_9ACTN|nr:hypothetical protein [Streptomyces fulvorobeus]GFN01240.1 hypothetical protein Sfulv_60500 [Streptomyces fulvorobeus]
MTQADQSHQDDELTPLERRLLAKPDPRGGYVPRDLVSEPENMPGEPASTSPSTGAHSEGEHAPEPSQQRED